MRRTPVGWLPALLLSVVLATAQGQEAQDTPRSGPEGSFPPTAAEQGMIRAGELFAQARSLEMLGRDKEAYALYRDAWKADPSNYRSLYHGGRLLESFGQDAEAELAYREATRIAPDFYAAQNALGLLLVREGRDREAVLAFRGAAEAAPDFAAAWRNLGRSMVDAGDIYVAVEPWLRAVELDPENVQSRITLGLLLARTGDFAAAREHLAKALELAPDNKRAEEGLAWVTAQPGSEGTTPPTLTAVPPTPEVEKGVRTSEDPVWVFNAPEVVLDNPEGLKQIGLDRVRRQQYERAVDVLERAARHGGPDSEVEAALGYALYRLGQPIRAAQAYGRAGAASDPPEAWYYVNRGIAFKHAGRLGDATRALGYAVKVNDDFAHAWYVLGLVRLERGQNRRALYALKKAVRLAPHDPDALTALAVAYVRLGHEGSAITSYRKALIERPKEPALLMSIARLLEVQGRNLEAAEAYAEFIDASEGQNEYSKWRTMAHRKANVLGVQTSMRKPASMRATEQDVAALDVYRSSDTVDRR